MFCKQLTALSLLLSFLLCGCAAKPAAKPNIASLPTASPDTKQPENPAVRGPSADIFVTPIAAQTLLTDGNAAAALAFDSYLAANPSLLGAASPAERTLFHDDLGRTILQLRGKDGGILPLALDALVLDTATGTVSPRYFAWRLQGGYRADGNVDVLVTAPSSVMSVWLPAEMEQYASVETGDWPSCLFSFSLKSSNPLYPGKLAELYSEPIAAFAAWDWGIYPQWSEAPIGARGHEIARDEQNVYLLAWPTDVQTDIDDAAETAQHEKLSHLSEFVADQFVLSNPVVTNPQWLSPSQGFTQNASGLRILLNSILLEPNRAVFTMPEPFAYAEPGTDFGAWEITLRGQRLLQNGGMETLEQTFESSDFLSGQTYALDLHNLKNAVLSATLPEQPTFSVQLQTETGCLDYKAVRENHLTKIGW